MLTLRQVDSIIHNNLLVLVGKGKPYKIERREEGTNIFFDVHDESGRFIGTYRVWEWHDGSSRSDWMPSNNTDPEIERIRRRIWEAIMAILVPASQTTEQSAGRSEATHPAPIDAAQGDWQEKRIEFECSQEKLFETIENLYRQQVITGYQWGMPEKDVIGDMILLIEKSRIEQTNLGEGLVFEEIGKISIGAINDDISILKARGNNLALLQFFDELVVKIKSYIPMREAGIQTAQVDAAQGGAEKPATKYTFNLGNEIVIIRYGTEQGSFKRIKGFEYLRHLLFAPNKDIDAKQFVIGLVASENALKYDDVDELHESRDKYEKADEPAIKEYNKRQEEIKQELGNLQDDIDELGNGKDGERAKKFKELTDEWEKINEHKRGVLGLGGKSRAFNDQDEKARVSVFRAIANCKRKIENVMPNFAEHLKPPILTTGYSCKYSPPDSIRWLDE